MRKEILHIEPTHIIARRDYVQQLVQTEELKDALDGVLVVHLGVRDAPPRVWLVGLLYEEEVVHPRVHGTRHGKGNAVHVHELVVCLQRVWCLLIIWEGAFK